MIKIKLATPYFFWGGGGWRQIILQKGGQQIQYCLCVLHYLTHPTNALIDSQAMVERMVCYTTAKPAGDNLESGSAIRHLHISYNASYLPTPLSPPSTPPPQKKEENLHKHCFQFLLRNEKPWF